MSKIIDHDHAKQLLRHFRKQNKSHMMTHEGKPLKGFYVDRESIEAVLKDESLTGIHFYIGKHHEHANTEDNVFTLIFVGAKPNPNFKGAGEDGKGDGGDDNAYTNHGDAYNFTNSCPDHCGDYQ